MRFWAALAVLVFVAAMAFVLRPGFGSYERWFAPKPNLWSKWQAHDPTATGNLDHSAWSEFLKRHLVLNDEGVALITYGLVTPVERGRLDEYILRLTKTPIEAFSRDVQLAYWINLYNALTVQVVLDHHPVEGIRDIKISPGIFGIGPWDKPLITIGGDALTLNDIEHRILRPIWGDPRLHYVLNCASVGCPNLGSAVYSADTIEEQLDAAARRYVNSERGVRLANGKLSVSKIYDWFIDDFGGTEQTVLMHIAIYADPDLKRQLASIGQISGQHYDWALNDASQ